MTLLSSSACEFRFDYRQGGKITTPFQEQMRYACVHLFVVKLRKNSLRQTSLSGSKAVL